MPEFKSGEEERERRKAARLAPVIEAAMARKQRLRPLADDEIPEYPAYGRMVLETDTPIADPAQRERLERMKAMRQALERRG
jgi:hypothetical protein